MRRELAVALSAALLAAAPLAAEAQMGLSPCRWDGPLLDSTYNCHGVCEKLRDALDGACLEVQRLESKSLALESDLIRAQMRLREHEIGHGLCEIQLIPGLTGRERAKRAVEFLERLEADEP